MYMDSVNRAPQWGGKLHAILWLLICSFQVQYVRPVVAQSTDEGAATAAYPSPITDADLRSLNSVSGLTLSPDGNTLAFSQGGDIWLLSTTAGSPARRIAAGWSPTWSQSGERIAYYSSGAEVPGVQVFAADVGTGAVQQVTTVEGGVIPDQISWSRDDRLAFIVAVSQSPDKSAYDHAPEPASMERGFPLVLGPDSPDGYALDGIITGVAGPHSEPAEALEVFVHDLTSGDTKQLSRDGLGCLSLTWSPDGSTIACVSQGGFQNGAPISDVHLLDGETGVSRQIAPGDPRADSPQWSPDGRRIAYARYSRAALESSGVSVVELDAGGQATRTVDVFSGPVVDLAWAADGQSLFIVQTDGVTQPVLRIELSTRDVRRIGTSTGVVGPRSLSVSVTGTVAWTESRGDRPAVVRLLRPETSAPEDLYDPNPQLAGVHMGRQEIVQWRNRAGDEREGILILPVGYESGRRYPLLVSAYSEGTHLNTFYSDPTPAFGNQRHAALGYAVFFPGPRVPWMYGGAATSDFVGGPAGWDVTVDDVESGVDVLIQRGFVDPDRMAIMGFSNGGAAATAVITRTDRYAAAVVAAPANLNWVESALRQDNQAKRWIPTRQFMGIKEDILENPAAYVAGSPVFQVGNITTPLLLAVGDRDNSSFTVPTVEVYLALRRLGRDVTLLRYAGMPHGFFGPSAVDLNERIDAFLDLHLEP